MPTKSSDRRDTLQSTQVLKPIGLAGARSRNVIDRKRNPRLNGADLYVGRFGGFGDMRLPKAKQKTKGPASVDQPKEVAPEPLSRCSSRSTSSDGSLHDELKNSHPKTQNQRSTTHEEPVDTSRIRASRPCYRCVTYMHSVGIRRVFWTTDAGGWESAKVRDLVDTLNGGDSEGSGSGCGMFVTKHEVLMMRRLMG